MGSRFGRRASYFSIERSRQGITRLVKERKLPCRCGPLSLPEANVPDFICAKMLAGDVLLGAEEGSGGMGGVDAGLLNGDCPNPWLNPVGSAIESASSNPVLFGSQNSLVCTPPKPPLFWNDGVRPKLPKLLLGIPVGCESMGPIEGKPVGCCITGWGLLGNPVTCEGMKGCCCPWKGALPVRVGTKLLKPVVVGINGCRRL